MTQREKLDGVPSWVAGSVVYQIFPDRFRNGDPGNDPPGRRPWTARPTRTSFFGGDLRGITDSLGHLEALGVNCLYLTPIFTSPSTHKYDTADYLSIDPAFGDLNTFRELVNSVHARGMRIILDGVFNHASHRHPFFEDARRRGPASSYWNWFSFTAPRVRTRPKPNYRHAGIYYIPTWNHANPLVREYLLSVAEHWTREGIDGWRLDVPWYIEGEPGHDFWREFRARVRSINPNAYLVGEHWGDANAWVAGDQFDAATDYQFRDATLAFASGRQSGPESAKELTRLAAAYPAAARMVMLNLVGSHDTPRVATLLRGRLPAQQAAAALSFTFPGIPLVYYGDEIGLRGGKDPDCRRPFPWDSASWNEPLWETYQRLSLARKASPALQTGSFRILDAGPDWLSFTRELGEECVKILVSRVSGWSITREST